MPFFAMDIPTEWALTTSGVVAGTFWATLKTVIARWEAREQEVRQALLKDLADARARADQERERADQHRVVSDKVHQELRDKIDGLEKKLESQARDLARAKEEGQDELANQFERLSASQAEVTKRAFQTVTDLTDQIRSLVTVLQKERRGPAP